MNTEFDPVTHIGKVNGEIWPSTTQLIKEFGLVDYSMVPPDRLEYKRKIGTRFAAGTLLIDNQSLDEDHARERFPELLPYWEGYRKFRVIEKFEPILKEVRLFSQHWKFHGAMDELALFEGSLAIVEYKCTWTLYPSAGPQTCSYVILLKENGKELARQYGFDPALLRKKIRRFGVLFNEKGNYSTPEEFTDGDEEQDFKGCVWMHWRRRNKYKTMNDKKLIEIYTGEKYDERAA